MPCLPGRSTRVHCKFASATLNGLVILFLLQSSPRARPGCLLIGTRLLPVRAAANTAKSCQTKPAIEPPNGLIELNLTGKRPKQTASKPKWTRAKPAQAASLQLPAALPATFLHTRFSDGAGSRSRQGAETYRPVACAPQNRTHAVMRTPIVLSPAVPENGPRPSSHFWTWPSPSVARTTRV